MPDFYRKKWFIVPHDEYPADNTLHLGQLVGSIDTISDSLNRTTLVAPQSSEINETFQTNSDITVFNNRTLYANLAVSSPFTPANLETGFRVNENDNLKFQIDVMQTQIFSPSDDYAKASFQASQQEPEMVNYMKKFPRPWKKNVFMITGRKVGKAMTVNRDEMDGFEQKIKIGFDVEGAAKVEASLDMDWKQGLKIGSLSEKPCIFAVHLRRVLYHADPDKPVTTKILFKGAVMGKDDKRKDEEEEDEGIELVFHGMAEEGPRADKFDFNIVSKKTPSGEEEEFLVKK
ncbi:hypothetical protein BDZ45DRAFT_675268 [Acephala macrosclerotiorum]|nr:hypothetical protein BDZ45DRAFT_675268 [Acephala macrosclerotiorum]